MILVPIAFVNDHIETLHELAIEYQEIAEEVGAEKVAICPAPNDNPVFIQGLADIVAEHLKSGQRVSPQLLMRCPMCTNPNCSKTKAWIQKVTTS